MKYIKIVLVLLLFFFLEETKAQLPLGDPTFSLQFQDDFDSLKMSKWNTAYNWGPVNNGLEYNSINNLSYTTTIGYLTIKCEKLATPITYTPGPWITYPYQSGVIYSKFKYKFGYFEISAMMPKGYGYWPAFWQFDVGVPGIGPCYNINYWNEIDILENNGDVSKADSMGLGYIWANPDSCQYANKLVAKPAGFQHKVPGNISQEHKYAVFWEPDRLTWYFDDAPMQTIFDSVYTPQHAINTIINFAIDPWLPPLAATSFPAYFKINYLKIWQLQNDCGTTVSFCNTFSASTWNASSQLKKSITIGGSGCTDNINTSDNVNFWATDFVLLDAGTTVTDNGSGSFYAAVTKCPN